MNVSEIKSFVNNSFNLLNLEENQNTYEEYVHSNDLSSGDFPKCISTSYVYSMPLTLHADLDKKEAERKLCKFACDSILNDPEFVDKKYIYWRYDPEIKYRNNKIKIDFRIFML